MAHYKFTNGGRVKGADQWNFQTNPYITVRPQISCIGDECKRSDLNIYYQYDRMQVNPTVYLQYVPIVLILVIFMVVGVIFLYRRIKANKKYEESYQSRIDDLSFGQYVDNL